MTVTVIASENWLGIFGDYFSIWINIILSISGLIYFYMFRPLALDPINMTPLCEEQMYGYQTTDVSSTTLTVLCMGSMLIVLLTYIWQKSKLYSTVANEMWTFTCGLFITYYLVDLIQHTTAVPVPYYFGNDHLRSFFCCGPGGGNPSNMTQQLINLDHIHRLSFPSMRMSMASFTFSYSFLYLDHMNINMSNYLMQAFAFVGYLYILITEGAYLITTHYCHMADVFSGVLLGIAMGSFTVRNIFGYVDRSHEHSRWEELALKY